MFDENPIENLISSSIEKIKKVIDVDTVVGSPIDIKNGSVIIPITKISVGFVSGGGEYGCDKKIIKQTKKTPMAGGCGGGVSVSPIGFIEVKEKDCKLIRIDKKCVYETVLEKIPGIINSVSNMIDKGDKK